MVRFSILLILVTAFLGCDKKKASHSTEGEATHLSFDREKNMLVGLSPQDLDGFLWLNEPDDYVTSDSSLQITVSEGSDFFVNPEDSTVTFSAPLLYKEVVGDFVATTVVKPDFSEMWNAACLMVVIDSVNWIKLAFENSDATGKSIVTVVTDGTSDDANGVVLKNSETIWLRIIRKGNVYALHWSKDGKDFVMARITAMPDATEVKVGMEAQCPVGKSAVHEFLYFFLEHRTVEDLREGE